ncbi:MAG: hypothetical protein Q7J25_13170 [Vicinamibacterales bacterium]|nr:hypothetical protein [Vicinamibacterales bacterium]
MVFLGGFLQVGRYLVDRREKTLSAIVEAEESKPTRLPINTGSVTVEILVDSDQAFNNHFLDQGAFLAFGRGTEPLMILRSIDCFANQLGNKQVRWRAVLSLDAADSAVGKTVNFLRDAEFVQIEFGPMPPKSKIVRGMAILTLNSAVRIEIPILPQEAESMHIFIRDLSVVREALK